MDAEGVIVMDLAERKAIELRDSRIAEDFIIMTVGYGDRFYEDGYTSNTEYTVMNRKRVIVGETFDAWRNFELDEVIAMAEEQGTRIHVLASNTINLKDFNSARVEAGMTLDVKEGQTYAEAFEEAWEATTAQVRTMRVTILDKVFGNS